jgi:choline dehydrogenase-like flavoprotein
VRAHRRGPTLKGVLGAVARPRGATALDESTLQEALNTCSHTLYHPVGTCRMGCDDRSVVDAPSVFIGEKAADLIRG